MANLTIKIEDELLADVASAAVEANQSLEEFISEALTAAVEPDEEEEEGEEGEEGEDED